MEGSVIDGDWDPEEGECDLRFDETLIDDVADIVEFYRCHGPQVPEGQKPLRTQRVAAAIAHRLDGIIEDMLEEGEEDEPDGERDAESASGS